MPTNDEGTGDAQEATEDKTSDNDTNDDDLLSSIEDEELREKVQNRITQEAAQKKHWRKKAENTPDEPEKNDSDDTESGSKSPESDELNKRIDKIEQNQKLAREGYSDKEISEARAYANGKNMDVTEAIETDFVQNAIQSMRSKQKSQENTPRPSQRVHVKDDKTLGDIINDEDTSKSEKDEALRNFVKERTGEGGASDYS